MEEMKKPQECDSDVLDCWLYLHGTSAVLQDGPFLLHCWLRRLTSDQRQILGSTCGRVSSDHLTSGAFLCSLVPAGPGAISTFNKSNLFHHRGTISVGGETIQQLVSHTVSKTSQADVSPPIRSELGSGIRSGITLGRDVSSPSVTYASSKA